MANWCIRHRGGIAFLASDKANTDKEAIAEAVADGTIDPIDAITATAERVGSVIENQIITPEGMRPKAKETSTPMQNPNTQPETIQVAVVEVGCTLTLVFPAEKLSEGTAQAEQFMDELLKANQEVIKGAMIQGMGARAQMVGPEALQAPVAPPPQAPAAQPAKK